ncbi:MAG: GNAT family N-acetyltransferase [Candidatus Sumerlaeaceae bacterium]|nr:GNAT family N-acetyltransferase [Candidatus Sumerlaeaceae bacterium]
MSSITLRRGTPADAQVCADIIFRAFGAINREHNFPPEIPMPEIAQGLASMLLSHPGFYGVVAEENGRIVGSNFLDERNPVFGIGPITVDEATQNKSIGRRLMMDVMRRTVEKGAPGVRLVQAAFHNRSLSLYAKLGFEVREPLAVMQGPALKVSIPGIQVRKAMADDVHACNAVCREVHGHDRGGELMDCIGMGTALVAEQGGEIVGYTSNVAFFGHSVARTNDGLKALIAASPEFGGAGFLLPTRNAELFRWCLANGLRVVEPMNLMSHGLYQEPLGAFLPSITY